MKIKLGPDRYTMKYERLDDGMGVIRHRPQEIVLDDDPKQPMTSAAQRQTVCHEIGHYWLDRLVPHTEQNAEALGTMLYDLIIKNPKLIAWVQEK